MTREEAITRLELLREYVTELDYKAIIAAIKALEQEPCKDAISREDARMMLTCEIKDGMTITEYIGMVDKRLRKLPPVTPQPKTGHWIKQTLSVKPFGEDTVLCDQCAFMTDKDNTYNYCPNCGARMESEE